MELRQGTRKQYKWGSIEFGQHQVDSLKFGEIPESVDTSNPKNNIISITLPWLGADSYYYCSVYYKDSPNVKCFEKIDHIYNGSIWWAKKAHEYFMQHLHKDDKTDGKLMEYIESLKVTTRTKFNNGDFIYVSDGDIECYGSVNKYDECKEETAFYFDIISNKNCTITPIDISQKVSKVLTRFGNLPDFATSQNNVKFVCRADKDESFGYNYLLLTKTILESKQQQSIEKIQILDNRLGSVRDQFWDGIGYGMYQLLQENRNPFRRVKVERDSPPTMWVHCIAPSFNDNNINLKTYGTVQRSQLTNGQLEQVGIPSNYLVKFIEGDKKKKEKNKVIFPCDLLFKRSDATYMCSLSFYVRSKTT